MQISDNTVVSVHYHLQDKNAEGQTIEKTDGGEPLTYIQGVGMMIPMFEEFLNNKKVGDTFAFDIPAAHAYGTFDEQAVVQIPASIFDMEDVDKSEILVVGRTLPLQDEDGNPMMGTVMEVTDEMVLMDFNHPLAGMDLHFSGSVVSVRAATAEELDHGHVHGEGGVQH